MQILHWDIRVFESKFAPDAPHRTAHAVGTFEPKLSADPHDKMQILPRSTLSPHRRAFLARSVVGLALLVPVGCLLPGYLAQLTIGMLSDARGLRDCDAYDMM